MENVVRLFRKKSVVSPAQAEAAKSDGAAPTSKAPLSRGEDFATVMERNAVNRERLRREREQANKGVLKSYRIK